MLSFYYGMGKLKEAEQEKNLEILLFIKCRLNVHISVNRPTLAIRLVKF